MTKTLISELNEEVSDEELGEVVLQSLEDKFPKNNAIMQTKKISDYGGEKKVAVIGIIAAVVIGGLIYVVSSINSHYTSKEYLRGKELEGKCAYILPASGKKVNYRLKDGRTATVEHYTEGFWGKNHLKISVGDVCFESEGSYSKNVGKLETLFVKHGDTVEVFDAKKEWQEEYGDLIDKIAESRTEFEKNMLDRAREK